MDGKAKVLGALAVPAAALIALLHAAITAPDQQPPQEVIFYASGKTRQACDVRRPTSAAQAPLVVIVHGGGGIRGRKDDWWPTQLAAKLADAGFVTVSINYRLAPEHRWPAAVDDVAAAIESFHARSRELSCDGTRIFLVGMSAGALFAEMHAAERPYTVDGVVSISGPQDLTSLDGRWLDALLGDTDPRAASPLYALRDDFPPTLLIHGEQDAVIPVRQSAEMRDALRARRCDVELVRVPGLDHFQPRAQSFSECYPHIVHWLTGRSEALASRNRPYDIASLWIGPSTLGP